MTLAQLLPQAQFVIVTTPQPTAQKVARRAAEMAHKVSLEIGGVIENMSGFTTPSGERFAIFGEGGGKELADELDVPLLGKVPLTMPLREHADSGVPLVIEDPDDPASQAIHQAARGLIAIGARRCCRCCRSCEVAAARARRARGCRAEPKTGGHVAADGLSPADRAGSPRRHSRARSLDKRNPLERIVSMSSTEEQQAAQEPSERSTPARMDAARRTARSRSTNAARRWSGCGPKGSTPTRRSACGTTRTRIADVLAAHDPDELEEGEHPELRYQIAGRLISRRGHPKTAFLDLRDLSGSIQVVVRVDASAQETYDRILEPRHRRHRRRRGLRLRDPARAAGAGGRASARC